MTEILVRSLARAREQTLALTADVPDDRMAEQPWPGCNHPAWVLGHLLLLDLIILGRLEVSGAPTPEPGWDGVYGPGSSPQGDRGVYLARADCLGRLTASGKL